MLHGGRQSVGQTVTYSWFLMMQRFSSRNQSAQGAASRGHPMGLKAKTVQGVHGAAQFRARGWRSFVVADLVTAKCPYIKPSSFMGRWYHVHLDKPNGSILSEPLRHQVGSQPTDAKLESDLSFFK